MFRLEDLQSGVYVRGLVPGEAVNVVSVSWHGSDTITLVYRRTNGSLQEDLLYRDAENRLEVAGEVRPWSFDGDGAEFRLVAEANRIKLAHLFDPLLAVHTSEVRPLPHQITAVYEAMLPRQPLRFLLADDPGAGKTIMAGLLIKELIARGDVKRCLIVCPGNLADQWQDELDQKFSLPFEILTNDKLETARTGNWFLENDLAIARLDKLARSENVQAKLAAETCNYDLVICDEAHKMSATFSGREVKYTKRYHLGKLLSGITRHFLLMTATPHNGKDTDFQLFLALLDGDRFEGRFRDGVHQIDPSDLMRRMVKEDLMTMEGKPLFPERRAYTVPYRLSDLEARLYKEVTEYVREEFNRAERLQNDGRSGTVGFALTILQRRLASSPKAIYQSLKRRRERLEKKQRELELLKRFPADFKTRTFDAEEIEDLEDVPETEMEELVEEVLDQATAAATIDELKTEITTLRRLEALAKEVQSSDQDAKWKGLAQVLRETLIAKRLPIGASESWTTLGGDPIPLPEASPQQKLVIFTEHRDTLSYLEQRIRTLLGHQDAVLVIHGGTKREDRRKVQERFLNHPDVRVLLATDAAGEGINLQRAHLMVNYDLPWNPNRLEQRFGRIHRIGQTEVCHLWNLVAEETREGDVYRRLLDKLEEARRALGGRVFDVLGKVQFEGKTLRDLLIEAIREGEQPEVRARLNQIVDSGVDQDALRTLLEERALDHETMNAVRLAQVRADIERAEARRLQPHYVSSFFMEAFKRLGGNIRQREPERYEIKHVPALIRHRDRQIGRRAPVLPKYERVVFKKELKTPPGQVRAELICPGQPLLDSVIDLTLERHRDVLKQGTILVDETDTSTEPRVLYFLDHAMHDAHTDSSGSRRVISRRMLYVEIDGRGTSRHLHYAPYLDYRPFMEDEPTLAEILHEPVCAWIGKNLDDLARSYAIEHIVPEHRQEVTTSRQEWIEKTRAAVHERLTKEIKHWDHRAIQLAAEEQAGHPGARLNSQEARRRADELALRLEARLADLKNQEQISAGAPNILGGLLVVPIGLIHTMKGQPAGDIADAGGNKQAAAAAAREVIMATERRLGFVPVDREFERVGYDIESVDPGSGAVRFIEVKGRRSGAATVTVTKNEILTSLNRPDNYILALVEFMPDGVHVVKYIWQPFNTEPDFGVTSVNYDFDQLRERGVEPR